MKVQLAIPVMNPGRYVRDLVSAIEQQTLRPDHIVVVDSSSDDGTVPEFLRLKAEIVVIPRSEFDHGGTRNLALSRSKSDVSIFLTQDAIPVSPNAFEELVGALLRHERAGMAYGRQVPHPDATAVSAHARFYNYPSESSYRTAADIPRLGIRTAFCSNSFAAYRRDALDDVGGLPSNIVFGEDTYTAARMLMRGWGIAYAAAAVVSHSHNYSAWQDFQRYFDLGVFHQAERWYTDFLGGAGREGRRFVLSEWRYLREAGTRAALVKVVQRNAMRWLGYRAGRAHRSLPLAIKRRTAMNRSYWSTARRASSDVSSRMLSSLP